MHAVRKCPFYFSLERQSVVLDQTKGSLSPKSCFKHEDCLSFDRTKKQHGVRKNVEEIISLGDALSKNLGLFCKEDWKEM